MELLLAREAAVIIASAAGSYNDYRTGFINDWITLPLMGLGLLLNIYEQQFTGIAIAAAVFAAGYAFYYTGKLGGGDVKLFTGIAMTLPFYGKSIFILNAALLSGLVAVVFLSTYFTIKYCRKGIDLNLNKHGIQKALLLVAGLGAYFYFMLGLGVISYSYAAVFGVPILFGALFVALEKGFKKEFFLKKIKTGEMEEDEIIALEFMEEKEVKKIGAGFKGVFGEKDKEKLLDSGIREILVYRELPRFGPFIFAGVLLALAMPEFHLLLTGGV